MMKPKCLRDTETEESKIISKKAWDVLNDKSLSDAEADLAISAYNAQLTALGIPAGGMIVSREEYNRV